MTPEERAKMKDALLDAGKRSKAIPYGPIVCDLSHGPYMELCLDRIAAALREAVKAEREACAKLAATFAPTEPSPIGPLHGAGMSTAAIHIAAAIRERPL